MKKKSFFGIISTLCMLVCTMFLFGCTDNNPQPVNFSIKVTADGDYITSVNCSNVLSGSSSVSETYAEYTNSISSVAGDYTFTIVLADKYDTTNVVVTEKNSKSIQFKHNSTNYNTLDVTVSATDNASYEIHVDKPSEKTIKAYLQTFDCSELTYGSDRYNFLRDLQIYACKDNASGSASAFMHVTREVVVNEGTSAQTKQLQCIVDGEYVRMSASGNNKIYVRFDDNYPSKLVYMVDYVRDAISINVDNNTSNKITNFSGSYENIDGVGIAYAYDVDSLLNEVNAKLNFNTDNTLTEATKQYKLPTSFSYNSAMDLNSITTSYYFDLCGIRSEGDSSFTPIGENYENKVGFKKYGFAQEVKYKLSNINFKLLGYSTSENPDKLAQIKTEEENIATKLKSITDFSKIKFLLNGTKLSNVNNFAYTLENGEHVYTFKLDATQTPYDFGDHNDDTFRLEIDENSFLVNSNVHTFDVTIDNHFENTQISNRKYTNTSNVTNTTVTSYSGESSRIVPFKKVANELSTTFTILNPVGIMPTDTRALFGNCISSTVGVSDYSSFTLSIYIGQTKYSAVFRDGIHYNVVNQWNNVNTVNNASNEYIMYYDNSNTLVVANTHDTTLDYASIKDYVLVNIGNGAWSGANVSVYQNAMPETDFMAMSNEDRLSISDYQEQTVKFCLENAVNKSINVELLTNLSDYETKYSDNTDVELNNVEISKFIDKIIIKNASNYNSSNISFVTKYYSNNTLVFTRSDNTNTCNLGENYAVDGGSTGLIITPNSENIEIYMNMTSIITVIENQGMGANEKYYYVVIDKIVIEITQN